ncbi:hypothetical protein LP414_27605 [Polaromonas sp. P1(28)-13]|nr:hypothetical protein LP414_27605 [Polaromonas sp. P1(28)-13]
MNKEQAYDTIIHPLMAQIIEACKTHGIAMIGHFDIGTPEDSDLKCSTCTPDGEGAMPLDMRKAMNILKPPVHSPLMMTIDHGDGTKTLTAIL